MNHHRSTLEIPAIASRSSFRWAVGWPGRRRSRPPEANAQATSKPAQHATVVQRIRESVHFRRTAAAATIRPSNSSPRITGTVLRHMRVRALLSPQDERDISEISGSITMTTEKRKADETQFDIPHFDRCAARPFPVPGDCRMPRTSLTASRSLPNVSSSAPLRSRSRRESPSSWC